MTTDLDEQIWHDEVDRFAEDTLAMWKTQYRFWQRANAQGAPPALLGELAAINELFRQAHARLDTLKEYFPKAEQ